jgi:3-deoxy-7-phosphoheptulonate synthase
MIDCSHDNAQKDHDRQPAVLADIARQVAHGAPHLMGVMVESHLVAGRQSIPADVSTLVYGQSITDACVDFQVTESMLRTLSEAVAGSSLQPTTA